MIEPFLEKVFRSEDYLFRILAARSNRAYRVGAAALVILVLATTGLLFLTGAAPLRGGGRDTAYMFGHVWRIYCGHRPHTDFYDYFGIGSVMPVVLGMFLSRGNANAFAYGPAALLPVMTFLAWQISNRRFSASVAAMLAATIGGLGIGTFALGIIGSDSGWRFPSYAMQYNRFQWAVTSLLALLVLVQPRQALARRVILFEGMITGGMVGLLLLGKLNYSIAAVTIVGMGILFRRGSRNFWLATTATCAGTLLLYLYYIRGDVSAFASDYAMLLGCRKPMIKSNFARRLSLTLASEMAAPLFILAVHLRRFTARPQDGGVARSAWTDILLVAVLCAISLVVLMGNAQAIAIPTWAIGGVILAEILGRSVAMESATEQGTSNPRNESSRFRACLGYVAALIAVATFAVPDFSSVAYAFVWKHYRAAQLPEDAKFQAEPMKCLLLPPGTFDPKEIARIREALNSGAARRDLSSFEYGLFVNDGLELLRGHIDADSRIFAFEGNPFPAALKLPPPKGASDCWDENLIADDSHHPPVDQVFHEVTHVMVAKKPLSYWAAIDTALVHRVCGPFLKEHFTPCGESKYWVLYVRKDNRSNN